TPGVKGFFSAKDVPGKNNWGIIIQDDEIFASKEVFCVGQVIGLIVAETKEIAQEAKSLVKIEYEVLPHILTIEEAIEQNSFFPMPLQLERGDIEKGFQEADYVFAGETRAGGQEHFYMETNVSLVIPKKENDEFEIFSSTQNVSGTQNKVAESLGIPANKVVSRVKRVGGAFGGKETKSLFLAMALAVGAWHLKKPIRCMLNREEDMIITGQRHPLLAKWKIGLTKDGKITSLDLKVYANAGCSMDISVVAIQACIQSCDGCYYIPNLRFVGHICKTNIHSNTAFRGFGRPQGVFIIESILSE
ncbi:11711_t:CDS:2, partial [Cetraspora pellucida]